MKVAPPSNTTRPLRVRHQTDYALRITHHASGTTSPASRFNDLTIQRFNARPTAAYLLSECLIYIGVFTLIVGLGFSAFYRTLEYSRDLRRNADDIVRALKAGERWRDDIRRATMPPRVVAGDRASVLEIPQASGVVSYTFDGRSLWRKTTQRDTAEEIIPGVKASQMQMDSRAHVKSWRWEIELSGRKKIPRVRPLFTFQAVPQTEEAK
ncbi:MAG: hypothetical protein HYY24_16120 [Verrucomicrobia bacterium]|nr:hypothetical protein [Verrucomicrobiota bacterium]